MAPMNAAQTCDTCVFRNGHFVLVRGIFRSSSAMHQIHHFRSTHRSMETTTAQCRTAHPHQCRQFHTTDRPRRFTRSLTCARMMVMQCPRFRELPGNFRAQPTRVTSRLRPRTIHTNSFPRHQFRQARRLLARSISGLPVLAVPMARHHESSIIGRRGIRMPEIATNHGFPITYGSACVQWSLNGLPLSGRNACLTTNPGRCAVRGSQRLLSAIQKQLPQNRMRQDQATFLSCDSGTSGLEALTPNAATAAIRFTMAQATKA